MEEMHPSKVHPTTGEPSSALRLGFSDIYPPNGKRGPREVVNHQPTTPTSSKIKPSREEMHPSKVHPTTAEPPARLAATPAPSKLKHPRKETQTSKAHKIMTEPSARTPSTPSTAKPKPPSDEMHPSKAHPTTGEPSSALRLGFSDIKSTGKRGIEAIAELQSTPTKASGVPSSPFTFQFTRETADTELSGDARRMMTELREKAAKIKADLVAQREAEGGDGSERKFAKPKGKSGRYSAAHMAEFKKMDSIEGHASAWRAQNGRFTPVTSRLKRTPSKANLETTPTSHTKSGLKRSHSKAGLEQPPATPRVKPSLKRSSSRANLDEYQQSPSPKKIAPPPSTSKPTLVTGQEEPAATKRLKKSYEDDASSARPTSRGNTSIPQPKVSGFGSSKLPASSSLARLMSPTKASLNHTGAASKPAATFSKSPIKAAANGTTQELNPFVNTTPRRLASPSRFQRVKSILRGHRTPGMAQTAIPQPAFSQTPAPPKLVKELPPVPLTTPRRKLTKRVAFTPEVTRIAAAQGSPSPQKRGPIETVTTQGSDDVQYPNLDSTLSESHSDDVVYPDLSALRPLPVPLPKEDRVLQPSAPGTFTFRSDHTIEFGPVTSKGFGASPGQSSVRHVRGSMMPTPSMPGSFPAPPSPGTHSNKENKAPVVNRILTGALHGMSNKKRHRATWDEEETEASEERAAKKRKNEDVPEGQALLAPRLMGKTPMSSAKKAQTPRSIIRATPASASPTKKRAMISMSRLNMLARPKNRN